MGSEYVGTPVTLVHRETDMQLVALGGIEGREIVNKAGRNPDIDSGTLPEDVWNGGGVYTGFPTQLETVQVVSTSAADIAGGTGARSVRIVGLDSSYHVQSEVIPLNGLTPVNSLNQYLRVHTARIVSAGSGLVNAGNIICRHSTTTANVFFNMAVGYNQTNVSAYTVPAGYSALLTSIFGYIRGGANTAIGGMLWIRVFGEVFRSRRPFIISSNVDLKDDILGGLVLPEKTDIIVRINSASANNIEVVAGYDLVLVKT